MALVHWAAGLPRSSGAVGLQGASYLGAVLPLVNLISPVASAARKPRASSNAARR